MEIFASYSGPDFLAFYAVMLVTCVFLGLWIPANLRAPGRRGELFDMEEIAVLAGGPKRHVQAIASSLFAKNGIAETEKKKLQVVRTEVGEGDAERTILTKVGDFSLNELLLTLRTRRTRIEADLERRGLLMSAGEVTKLRLLSVTPYVALFGIGLYRQQAGEALGEPTNYLIGLLCLTALAGLTRLVSYNPRTMAGNAAIKELEERSSRLKRAPSSEEAGFAVAIFGTAVLVGTPWEPVHAMRQSGAGGDGGSSGDSGCGGGGCGGGCGGCGG